MGRVEIPQRSSLLPYRGVLSFRSEAREVSGSETAGVHHAARRRGGIAASAIAGQAAAIMIGAASRLAMSDLVLRKFFMVRNRNQKPSACPRQGGRSARLIAGASRG